MRMTRRFAGKRLKTLRAKARLFAFGAAVLGLFATAGTAQAETHHFHAHHDAYHARHLELASAHRAYGEHYIRHTHYLHEAHYVHELHHPAYHHRLEYAHYYHHRLEYAHYYHHRYYRYAARYRHSYLQCVPYAREVSHIELTGDAFLWWAEAAGRYARGNMPEEGAVLNFRAIGRMPLGHVAVVTGVVDSRTILVTQANWVRGTITNDVTVQDVSPDNNWTEVEVELGDSKSWGAPYPTYGFIYDKPAVDTVIAENGQGTEVAEAPPAPAISAEAPDRNLQ